MKIAKIIKKLATGGIIVIVGLYLFGSYLGNQENKELEPKLNEYFKNLDWEIDSYIDPIFDSNAEEVEAKFKNIADKTLNIKIGYKLKDYDGVILEEGESDYINISPGDTKLVEIPLGYVNVDIENLEFKLLDY
ncbi:hypothetical protein CHL78_007895 [Romboutsia weinsteinii]|uniref:Uncharacterized protein n=1 Tax=Romboutsia weinsteinii TaxID=2020949 RepID=A0A371J5G9_9FIRM|nr:hypothetical protein [Romboutsia weinsteinii]RDY27916.1 hypothetical protein CHL78_007895 [Romboutsia weinsteinii]